MGCATSKPPPASSTGNSSNPQVLKPSMDAVLRAASSEPGERQKTKQRERIVYAKGFSEGLHFEKIPKKIEELKSICTIFDACYVFSNLSQEQKEDLGAYMKRVDLVEGDKVENCHSLFYGIDYGSFEFKNEEEKSSGESRSHTSKEPFFGEMSLMFNSERSGQTHAICISDFGRLWAIDRDTFRQVIASSDLQSRDEKRNAVTSIKLLKDALNDEQLNRLIEAVHMLRFPIGHQIVRKGDVGEVCYFIKQGTVLCSKIGENQLGQVELSTGSYFGERALLRDEPRAADVHAVTDVIAMALNRKEFDELLGPLRSVMDSNMKERVVEGLPILKELSPRLRQEVIADFELESFEQGEYIVTLGDVNVDKFYVVRAGVVTVLDGDKRTIATLKEGNWFGEMAFSLLHPLFVTTYLQFCSQKQIGLLSPSMYSVSDACVLLIVVWDLLLLKSCDVKFFDPEKKLVLLNYIHLTSFIDLEYQM
jgi:CRP-like cAMP-binding protein